MEERRFSDIGRVAAIEALYEGTPYRATDSIYFETGGKSYVTSRNRLFLEGLDFDLTYFPLRHLGYRCVSVVSGDLYAELSSPRTLDIRVGISSKLDFAQIKELWEGMVTAAGEHGYKKVGLDLIPSRNGMAVSVSASGETPYGMDRQKPQVKDLICVSGSLGAAFFGQQVLERGKRRFEKDGSQPELEKYKMMVASYLKPEISPYTLSALKEAGITPSMGYLIDRGLADAVKRLVRDSSLGAKVYAGKIPFEGNSFELGKELDIDPISAAMNGGEDYRLLYVVPISSYEKLRHDFQAFDIIGHMAREDVGAVMVTPDGLELPLRAQGWNDAAGQEE